MSMTTSGLKFLFLCLGEVLHLLEIQKQQKTFILSSLLISGENKIKKKLRTFHKNNKKEKLLFQARK